jgi:hypothetical protein
MRKQHIFISSVMRDYEDRRAAAEKVVRSLGMEPLLAEAIRASGGSPRDVILKDAINGCHAMVGIYGPHYGWTGTQSQRSPTEEEYDHARELYKPIYAFIDRIESKTVDLRQQAFLDKVQNWDIGVLRREFYSLGELQELVREALTGRDLSPRYRRFLDVLVVQTQNLNGLAFREETEPFVPALDLVLHATASQFTAGVDSYIIVIDGDLYDRQQISRAIENWSAEVNRLIGAGFWKARGASSSVLVVVEENPYGYNKNSMQKDRRLFTSSSHDEMLVNLVARNVEVPPGNLTLFNPLKKAVESAL